MVTVAMTETDMTEQVNSPTHYQRGGIETIDYIRATLTPEQFEGYCIGNALKYLSRYKDKGGVTDLQKAQVYLGWAVVLPGDPLPKAGMTVPRDEIGEYDPVAMDFDAFRRSIEIDQQMERAANAIRTEAPTAAELAQRDGAAEYGNPVTPGCAPWKLP